jgi:hypothetical protein
LQGSNVGKRRPESRKQGAANRLLLAAEMVLKELVAQYTRHSRRELRGS